jgi:hypothetical protein
MLFFTFSQVTPEQTSCACTCAMAAKNKKIVEINIFESFTKYRRVNMATPPLSSLIAGFLAKGLTQLKILTEAVFAVNSDLGRIPPISRNF